MSFGRYGSYSADAADEDASGPRLKLEKLDITFHKFHKLKCKDCSFPVYNLFYTVETSHSFFQCFLYLVQIFN